MDDEYDFSQNDYETVIFSDYKIHIVSSSDSSDSENDVNPTDDDQLYEFYPDHWVSFNRNNLMVIFEDIYAKNKYYGFLDESKFTFSAFADYMEYVNDVLYTNTDILDWNNKSISDLCFKKHKRCMNPEEYLHHFVHDLFDLYRYLKRTYKMYTYGCFEDFYKYMFNYY